MGVNTDCMYSLMEVWKRRDVDGYLAHLTDDVEYHWHVGSKPLRGKEKMRKFLKNYSAAFEQREWNVLHTAENGKFLMAEGLEVLYDKTHDRVIQQPFMQIYEFRDGKIARMRDDYEPANLRPPAAVTDKPATAKSATSGGAVPTTTPATPANG
jgi:limonene-1,2-epoxide hydrolase